MGKRWDKLGHYMLANTPKEFCDVNNNITYFPHSHEGTIPHQKLTANGEDFAEESFIRGTLLSIIFTVCFGLY